MPAHNTDIKEKLGLHTLDLGLCSYFNASCPTKSTERACAAVPETKMHLKSSEVFNYNRPCLGLNGVKVSQVNHKMGSQNMG